MSRTTRCMVERHPAFTGQPKADSISEVSKPAVGVEPANALLAEEAGKTDTATHRAPRSFQHLDESGLAYRPAPSAVFTSPVLANEVHQRLVAESI